MSVYGLPDGVTHYLVVNQFSHFVRHLRLETEKICSCFRCSFLPVLLFDLHCCLLDRFIFICDVVYWRRQRLPHGQHFLILLLLLLLFLSRVQVAVTL